MLFLLAVSLIWAFSFGLIKGLSGVDSTAIAVARSAISLLVFLPLFRRRGMPAGQMLRLAAIGAVQFGAMYAFYLRAYAFLHAYQVALFTITTPLFVILLDAAAERRWRGRYLAAAALSVAGAAVLVWRSVGDSGAATGFVLVQLSNVSFAAGQLAWRRERPRLPAGSGGASVFALLYAGSLALTLAVSAYATDWRAFQPSRAQWATIAYLGAVASGLGFFLWNVGASRVNAGALAAFNNAKIPLGVACALLVFGESADLGRLAVGAVLMALGVWAAGTAPEGPSGRAAAPAA
jgi:drug/metabolite transporter (DMT)-like permease